MKKVLCLLLILIMCISLVACVSREEKAENAIELNWQSVHDQYISNPVKAKDEYDGKIVKWTATVIRINDGFVDMANYTKDGYINQIMVYLDKEDIMKLSKRQNITVVGKLKLSGFTEIVDAFVVE